MESLFHTHLYGLTNDGLQTQSFLVGRAVLTGPHVGYI